MSQMDSYKGFFEPWEIRKAVKVVQAYQESYRILNREDFEDVLQEVLIHWLGVREKIDFSERRYAMNKVVVNKLMDLLRSNMTSKRRANYSVGDFDINSIPCEQDVLSEMEASVAEAISELPLKYRQVCELILAQEMSMDEIAKEIGRDRATVYRWVAKCKSLFEKRGLRTFLK